MGKFPATGAGGVSSRGKATLSRVPAGVAELEDDEPHEQEMSYALERVALGLLDGGVATGLSRLSLGIPHDGPALAGTVVSRRKVTPIERCPGPVRPWGKSHA